MSISGKSSLTSTSFAVDVKDVLLVKPSTKTPSGFLPLSTLDSDNYLDVPAYSVYVYRETSNPSSFSNVELYTNNSKPNPDDVLREGLSKALVYYYPLAGRLKRQENGRYRVNCDAAGVPFVVASANCKLSEVEYFDSNDHLQSINQLVSAFPTEDENGKHPLVLQVTKFRCGGFTVGMGTWHSICDGSGAVQIFHALAEFASGKTEPSVKPVWERERLIGSDLKEPLKLPIDPAVLATSPTLPPSEYQLECFHVDEKSIGRLKMSLSEESDDKNLKESFTTVEALSAYLWRARSKALSLDPAAEALFLLTVGIRKRVNPPLPLGYYGNGYVDAYVMMKVKDLIEGPLLKVVKCIKEQKGLAFTDKFIRNSLDYTETFRLQKLGFGSYGAFLQLTEWRQFGMMQEADFGWGASVNNVPVVTDLLEYKSVCIITLPSGLDANMKNGVKVFVTLPKTSMIKFREEIDALKHGN